MHMRFLIGVLVVAAAASEANAGVITLDFDSPATGSLLPGSPLVTPYGTITATASGGSGLFLLNDFPQTGMSGNSLLHLGTSDGSDEYGQLGFSFPVSSVSFLYGGWITGKFWAQILDAGFNPIASFSDLDTTGDLPGGPIVLSGSDIRYLRFGDLPGGQRAAVIDDVRIDTPVPEPATMLMLGGGLLGLAARRRRRP
jgi:hypothetical protein